MSKLKLVLTNGQEVLLTDLQKVVVITDDAKLTTSLNDFHKIGRAEFYIFYQIKQDPVKYPIEMIKDFERL